MLRPKQNAISYGYSADNAGVAYVADSARAVVPFICDSFHPASVLDIGCGTGDWLRAFIDNGVSKVAGYDGPWVPIGGLQIPAECFHPIDFYSELPEVGTFDLSICLEVAEHVSPEVATRLISLLCRSADLVLFSAAIPGQGGYEHINEHFQDYWIAEFRSLGFFPVDCVRPHFWMNDKVQWWYQQNCIIFANAVSKEKYRLKEVPVITSLIHPAHYERVRDPRNYSLKQIARNVPHYLRRTLRRVFS